MKCRLCGNNSTEKIKRKEDLYYHCKRCDLIFIDEKEFPSSEEEMERYSEHDNTHENEGYVNMFEKFINKTIHPYKEKMGNEVLEFGCGPGPVLADLLEEKGFRVDKYDPYFFPEKIYKTKKYDLITSTEVWEHLEKPHEIIELLVDHIKESGFLAVMTSFHPGIDNFKEWWYPWDPTHIVFYNENTFKWIAEEFSLNIKYIDGEKYCLFQLPAKQ